MLEIGLTGGIGSGKSTAAASFVAHGAALIDADQIVRDLQQPGEKVLDVGCGMGKSTLAHARAVGPTGKAVGIDI